MARGDKHRWRDFLRYLQTQWPALAISLAALLLSWRANCVSTEQKELSRLDHLPVIEVSLNPGPDADNLVVENKGFRLQDRTSASMKVEAHVFFDVRPCIEPCGKPAPLLRYVVDDCYRDIRQGDYEGSQRRVYGLALPPGTPDFLMSVSRALQDSLPAHGRRWQGIEVSRAIKVVYWDWVGVRMEEHYSDEDSPGAFKRVARKNWNTYVTNANSARGAGRRLLLGTKTPDADRQRVVEECIRVAR